MSEKKYKILIMSAPIGSGHALAAKALGEELKKIPGCEVFYGSAFDFFPIFIGRTILKSYLYILKHVPGLYKIAYKWGNNPSGSLWLRNGINNLLAHLADGYLSKVKPDAVVATHATPAGIVSAYKNKHKVSKLLLASVITDFTIHKWWLCDRTDCYFLAANNLKPTMRTLPGQKIFHYGIPVRSAFGETYDRKSLREKYGWADQNPVCLLMGGGEGLLPMREILTGILGMVSDKIRFVAITGRNKELALELKQLPVNIEIYGFTDEIPKLMHAADFIISKAGGLTAAETITTSLRYIIYKPLPGQEEANAEYLKMAGAADIAFTPTEVATSINAYRLGKKEQVHGLGKPEAAEKIAKTIIELLNIR